MQAHQLESFKALDDDGVFADIFDQVAADTATQWARAETPEAREELWQRQRALRDLRRVFRSTGGLDA